MIKLFKKTYDRSEKNRDLKKYELIVWLHVVKLCFIIISHSVNLFKMLLFFAFCRNARLCLKLSDMLPVFCLQHILKLTSRKLPERKQIHLKASFVVFQLVSCLVFLWGKKIFVFVKRPTCVKRYHCPCPFSRKKKLSFISCSRDEIKRTEEKEKEK
jgi:hypothetical protein